MRRSRDFSASSGRALFSLGGAEREVEAFRGERRGTGLAGRGDMRLLWSRRWMLVLNCCEEGKESGMSAERPEGSASVEAVRVLEWSAVNVLEEADKPVGEWTIRAAGGSLLTCRSLSVLT